MAVSNVPWLTILLFYKKSFQSLVNSGYSKKLMIEIGDFALRKKGLEKTWMLKVTKSCHQVTWTQKNVAKERELG